jgi:WD40 repeat protein
VTYERLLTPGGMEILEAGVAESDDLSHLPVRLPGAASPPAELVHAGLGENAASNSFRNLRPLPPRVDGDNGLPDWASAKLKGAPSQTERSGSSMFSPLSEEKTRLHIFNTSHARSAIERSSTGQRLPPAKQRAASDADQTHRAPTSNNRGRAAQLRGFQCQHCEKAYACQDTLMLHLRLDHRDVPSAISYEEKENSSGGRVVVDAASAPDDWMPKVRQVLGSMSTTNAVWGGYNKHLGHFLACGGADKRVALFSLEESMPALYSIPCSSAVNAICGSDALLAYGLRSGAVLLWDLARKILAYQLPSYSQHGRICALWMSPDSTHLVVVTDCLVETWVRQASKAHYELAHSFETLDVNSRFRGQHSICGVVSAFTWPRTRKNGKLKVVEKGDFIMAVGARDTVTLWSLASGVVQEELMDISQTCNCVWMSPGGSLLATAGGSNKIMVWTLPDLALLHVFPCTHRVWALWGDARILASAGADSIITIRSLETGAMLMRLQRPAVVYGLWGSSDLGLLASAGRAAAYVAGTDVPTQARAGGSVTVRHLASKQVLYYVEGLHPGSDTECMWTNGRLLAWAGVEFVTVMALDSGQVLAPALRGLPCKLHRRSCCACARLWQILAYDTWSWDCVCWSSTAAGC